MTTHEETMSLWRRIVGPSHGEVFESWLASVEHGELIEIRYSRRYWVPVLVLAAGLIGLGVITLLDDDSVAGLVAMVLMSGPLVWVGGTRTFSRAAPVVIGEQGILIRKHECLVPWAEILRAREQVMAQGFGWVVLDIDREWAKRHLWFVLPLRRRPAILSMPSGLTMSPGVLAACINARPYGNGVQAEHLLVWLGVDGEIIEELSDPSGDVIADLVLRVADGARAAVSVTHLPSDSTGATFLEVVREPATAMLLIEHQAGEETGRYELSDISTAAEQVAAWIRRRDLESGDAV